MFHSMHYSDSGSLLWRLSLVEACFGSLPAAVWTEMVGAFCPVGANVNVAAAAETAKNLIFAISWLLARVVQCLTST